MTNHPNRYRKQIYDKEFKPDVWKIKEITKKRSFLNWFPVEEYEIETDYVKMTGGKEMLNAAMLSGAKLEWTK